MDFVTISVKCSPDLNEVIIAELFEIGFDSFQEFENGFEGSCDGASFSEKLVAQITEKYQDVSFTLKEQEKINWNEEWEKNYDPILIDGKCHVRATFHPADPSVEYDILVNPKMSFGTGHHATTYQMISYQMKLDHKEKKVLDVGCGTGILSIMAAKLGASKIVATDIDDWSIENSIENFSLNQTENIQLIKGQIEVVEERDFNIILANINKNVLMEQVGTYALLLSDGGYLLLSGYYKQDVAHLLNVAENFGLNLNDETEKENWAMLALIKPNS